MQMAAGPDLHLDAVANVDVHTVRAAMPLVCEPIEQKRRPKVMIDAQFSVAFNVALGLVKKHVRFTDLTPRTSPHRRWSGSWTVSPVASIPLWTRMRLGQLASK